MQATVYIPTVNGSVRLARVLASLKRQRQHCDVVVVDNGSSDGSVAMARERFPWVEIVELKENLGFGRALNLAIAKKPGDPIVLLNDDVECEPGFVSAMLDALSPEIEMVAGVLTQRGAPTLVDSAGVIADRRTLMAFDYLRGQPVSAVADAPPPLAPTGGAALYRRRAFESVGGFDERIFAYYEDLDLALRLRAGGASCALAPDARASHASSATLGSRSGEKYALTGWSRGYLLRRYGVMTDLRAATQTLLCELAVCAGQIMLDGTAMGAKGRLQGWRDAAGLPRRPVPAAHLAQLPPRVALARRLRGRGKSSPR